MTTQAVTSVNDPYSAWLNVRGKTRPYNAYQLLGLDPETADDEAIRQAVISKRATLQSHQRTAPSAQWNRIYEELERAIAALTDPAQKRRYDAELRGEDPDLAEAAAQGPTRALVCVGCGRENSEQRNFCAGCGDTLWEPCLACSKRCQAGEAYCGSCGANQVALVRERRSAISSLLEQARQLHQNEQYDEALVAIREIVRSPHSLLAPILAEVDDQTKAFVADRRRHREEAKTAPERAEERLQAGDYVGALLLLEKVPKVFRTPAITDLIARVRFLQSEIVSLKNEIRAAARLPLSLEILPKVERLLSLVADDGPAGELHKQLLVLQQQTNQSDRERLIKEARQRLGEHRYQQAEQLLRQIVEEERNEQVTRLTEFATETSAIAGALKTAPVVDPPLLALAQRLQKLDPGNGQLPQAMQQLKQRLAAGPKDSRHAYAAWRKAPASTTVQAPVEWLGGLERIAPADQSVQQAMRAQPGMFLVAAGLALQGIGRGLVNLNLARRDRSGMLGQLTSMVRGKSARSAWGIDLSPSGLKAVKLVAAEKGNQVVMEAVYFREHAEPSLPATPDKRHQAETDTIKAFVEQHKLAGSAIAVGLAGPKVLGRVFRLPPMAARKVAGVVEYEARHQIPYPLAELDWDHQVIDRPDEDTPGDPWRDVVLAAIKRFQLSEHLAPLAAAGIVPDIVQSDCMALYNLLAWEQFPDLFAANSGASPPAKSAKATTGDKANKDADGKEPAAAASSAETEAARNCAQVALDIGASSSNLVVIWHNGLWFRSIGRGGGDLTKGLMRELNLTAAVAEQVKREPAKARRFHQFESALWSPLGELVQEIHRSLKVFQKDYPEINIDRFLIFGGGARAHGLYRYLLHGRPNELSE